MAETDKDFLKKLLATFKVEAEEHLKQMTAGLIALEKTPLAEAQQRIVETVFREAHSLKGAARAVNMAEVVSLCQALETVFSAWKRNEITASPELFDLLHQTVNSFGPLLGSPVAETAGAKARSRELARSLEEALKRPTVPAQRETHKQNEKEDHIAAQPQPAPFQADEKPEPMDTVRIAAAKLDAVFLKTEELLAVKLATSHHAAELKEIAAALDGWKRTWAKIQPEVVAIRTTLEKSARETAAGSSQLTKIGEFLDWNRRALTEFETKLAALQKSTEQDHRVLGGMVDDLLADMKKVLMLPFNSISETFPGLMRSLARDQAKQVQLVVEGSELELDRRILEEIKDPLIHLLRNCMDHGIEKPEERQQKGKPPQGTIRVAIAQKDSRSAEILIADDGRGIDLAKVRASAVRLGQIAQQHAETLTDKETLTLVFRSGVSTSPIITDISGRGLGLAIVREKAEKLGGTVTVESLPGAGTMFQMILPLTVATFRGIPVRVGESVAVIPSSHVERVTRIEREKIKTVENKETIELDGKAVSLVHLADPLNLPRPTPAQETNAKLLAVLIRQAETRIAFVIDEVLNEQEVLVKGLGRQLVRVRNVAGATVLANREIAPILNVSDLMRSAVNAAGGRTVRDVAAARVDEESADKRSLLVVEDSITARTLLKSILEAAGFDVKSAVDGIDGLTQLRSGAFDLVISDVEMPRLNGFELTAKIRSDKKLSELPVILVTALESREDKERGIDVGANAYIVKSSFDQSNLLETIRRLI